jgi:hypothetical protein
LYLASVDLHGNGHMEMLKMNNCKIQTMVSTESTRS